MNTCTVAKPRVVHVIGCGAVVDIIHKSALRQLVSRGMVRLGYCFDRDWARASAVGLAIGFEAVEIEAAFWELIKPGDLLLVSTPPEWHYSLACRAIEMGVDVFLEKPFAASLIEAEDIIKKASCYNVRAHVAHVRRFFDNIKLAKRELSSVGGRSVKISAYEGGRWGWPSQSRYPVVSLAGGVLLDTGVHTIDSIVYLTGLDQLSMNDVSISSCSISKDKEEPSQDVEFKFSVIGGTKSVHVVGAVSRTRDLANYYKIEVDGGAYLLDCGFSGCLYQIGSGRSVDRVCGSEGQGSVDASILDMWCETLYGVDSPNRAERHLLTMRIIDRLISGVDLSLGMSK